jgi:hypothetical protein
MRTGVLVIVAVVAIVAVVVVGTVVVLTTVDSSPTALTVNSQQVSEQTLTSELRGFSGSSFFADNYRQSALTFRTTPGAVNSVAGAQWVAFRVGEALMHDALANEGAKVTQSDLDESRKSLQGSILEGMGSDASDQLVRLQASLNKLVDVTGSEADAQAAIEKVARNADVTISPRFGTWNAKRLAVCPPSGCRTAVPVLPSSQ